MLTLNLIRLKYLFKLPLIGKVDPGLAANFSLTCSLAAAGAAVAAAAELPDSVEDFNIFRIHIILTIASIWGENMRFEEQITSKDKYSSIFSPQMEATVFIIFQISLNN